MGKFPFAVVMDFTRGETLAFEGRTPRNVGMTLMVDLIPSSDENGRKIDKEVVFCFLI
jgi:hypothetical protein